MGCGILRIKNSTLVEIGDMLVNQTPEIDQQ